MSRLSSSVAFALACFACKPSPPRDFQIADFTVTVPGNWGSEASPTSSPDVHLAELSRPGGDVTCMVNVFHLEGVTPDIFFNVSREQFQAKASTELPSTLPTGLAELKGIRFDGKIPAKGATGVLAQFAGTPHVESYAHRDGPDLVGAYVVSFGDDSRAARDACRDVLKTLRRTSRRRK